MKIKNIEWPLYFDRIEDVNNDNIDVFVELEDGMSYTMVITTPKYYYEYMDKERLDYIPASPPEIIVRRLTKENIRKAIETYVEDNAYWLKLYFLAGERKGAFDMKLMDKMIDEIKKFNDEL